MCPYERNRPPEEYPGTYREAAYAEAKAKEYGFSDVHIERFPLGTKQWDGEMAELWVTEPGPPQLVTRYRDVPATLATGSRSGGRHGRSGLRRARRHGRRLQGKDVKGKIVLVSGPVGAAHNLAVRQFGAEGVRQLLQRDGQADRSARSDGLERHQGGGPSIPAREDDVGLHPVAADGPRSARRGSSGTST